MTLHTAFAVRYGASGVIAGITNLNTSLNPEVKSDPGPGSPFPQFAVILSQKPKLMFSSQAVAAALGVTGATGAVIDATNNLFAFFAQLGSNGLPAAGNVHRSYTFNRGLLVPRRLNVQSRQFATLDMEALTYSSDGAAHPMVLADNAVLPAVALDNVHHTIGKVVLGSGTSITADCINNISIDFGSRAETVACGSALYDQHLQQPAIQPVITLRGINASVFAASGGVPPVGLALTHAGSTIFLRKYASSGIGFVADATAEHIAMTFDGVAVVTEHTGQGTQRAEVSIQITTKWDGTNAPITIDTAADIT